MDVPCPASKRIKLDNCLICNNISQSSKKREAYTELLINHLLPPSQRDRVNRNSKVFDFCDQCSNDLENLFQLKEGLEFILNNIKSSIEAIKFSILKNGSSGNTLIDNFRVIAVQDMCPTVRMYKNNQLMTKEKKTEQKKVCEDFDCESPSDFYTYEEYDDTDEPMSVDNNDYTEDNVDTFTENENIVSTSSRQLKNVAYSSKPTFIANENSNSESNSSSGSGFDSTPTQIKATPTELNKPASANLEDSIITVFEPPKFSFNQWQVYYENYKDMYKCKFCSTIIKGENLKTSLARHINVIHAKNSRFKCGICFAIFFSKIKCRSHIGETHYEIFNMPRPKIEKEKEKVLEPVSKSLGIISTSYTHTAQPTEEPKKKNNSVAKKKTTPKNVKRNFAHISTAQFENESSSSGGKYADDKIRSEVVINIEPKSKYNMLEDIVKFEPWDETSRETETSGDPLSKSPEMIPTEEPPTPEPDENYEEKEWSRPMLSYAQLAILAIKNGKNYQQGSSTISEICSFIVRNYPYFKTEPDFRRKIAGSLSSASRKYFRSHLIKTLDGKQLVTTRDTRTYTINDEALVGHQEVFEACFKESAYAMAHPEQLDEMIKNLWNIGPREPADDFELKDSIDIVDGIGVKLDTDSEKMEIDSPKVKGDNINDTVDDGTKLILRPSLSYGHLAFLALSNSKSDLLRTEVINEFIKETFPFYKKFPSAGSWRSQMSKTLSCSTMFIKCGPGPYYWKLNDAVLPQTRSSFKRALMKALVNFHFSLAHPDKLEELLRNALGDEIDIEFVKTFINDFSSGENLKQKYQSAGDNYNSVPAPESFTQQDVEGDDDDVVEICRIESESTASGEVQVKYEEQIGLDDNIKIQSVKSVVGQPMGILRKVSLVPVNDSNLIEIVEEGNAGSSYVYKVNDDSTISFVTMKKE